MQDGIGEYHNILILVGKVQEGHFGKLADRQHDHEGLVNSSFK
jgi:hypothetical protein